MHKKIVTLTTLETVGLTNLYNGLITEKNYEYVSSVFDSINQFLDYILENVPDSLESDFLIKGYAHIQFNAILFAKPSGGLIVARLPNRTKHHILGFGCLSAKLKELEEKNVFKWLRHEISVVPKYRTMKIPEQGEYYPSSQF